MSHPSCNPESITIQNVEAGCAGKSMAHIKCRHVARLCRDMGGFEMVEIR